MSSTGSRPLRVGRIDFANCTPLFMALEEGEPAGVEFVRGVPSALNGQLREGAVDLSPSSSVEYLRNPSLYGFLPDLSISSIGPVLSVCLFSRLPLRELHGRPVGLTSVSATSVVLVRVLLEKYLGVHPVYDDEIEGQDAVVWIGDRALRAVQQGTWPRVYDLGSLWFEHTRTPFVFALWICRRDVFAARPGDVRGLYRRLLQARHLAYRSYADYARRSPETSWLGEAALLDYWQTISYDLTAWHLEGLRRFAADAAALGLLASVPPIVPLPVEAG